MYSLADIIAYMAGSAAAFRITEAASMALMAGSVATRAGRWCTLGETRAAPGVKAKGAVSSSAMSDWEVGGVSTARRGRGQPDAIARYEKARHRGPEDGDSTMICGRVNGGRCIQLLWTEQRWM